MSIFDLFDDGTPIHHAFTVLEFGIFDAEGQKHYRCTAWGGNQLPTVQQAQDLLRERFPQIKFEEPSPAMRFEDVGTLAYNNRWNAAFIYRTDTGTVLSVGWLQ